MAVTGGWRVGGGGGTVAVASGLDGAISIAQGLQLFHKGEVPHLSEEECKLVQHVCGVLTPFKVATKSLEGDSCTASMFEPTIRSLIGACQPEAPTPLPKCKGRWGSQGRVNKKRKFIRGTLHPIAKDLKKFLARDLEAMLQKHLYRPGRALQLCRMAALLDIRYKSLEHLTEIERSGTIKAAREAMFAVAMEGQPQILQQEGKKLLGEEAFDQSTAVDVAGGRGQGRGRGRGRGRAAKPSAPQRVLKECSSSESDFGPRHLRAYGKRTAMVAFGTGASVREGQVESAVLRAKRMKQDVDKAIDEWLAVPEATAHASPLQYWHGRQKAGQANPHLITLVRRLFSIPGSNAMLERAFSHSGRAVNTSRPRLSSDRAESLIFLHENYIRGVLA